MATWSYPMGGIKEYNTHDIEQVHNMIKVEVEKLSRRMYVSCFEVAQLSVNSFAVQQYLKQKQWKKQGK